MMSESLADTFEVSPLQEQLWLVEPDGPAAALQIVLDLRGPLDAAALERALEETVARHEILRTTFAHRPGIRVPLQAVNTGLRPSWRSLDIAGDSAGDDDGAVRLEELRRGELSEPFD